MARPVRQRPEPQPEGPAWMYDPLRNGARRWDPTELARLARFQWPQRPELAELLAQCEWVWPRNDLYAYLCPPVVRERHWSFVGSLFLRNTPIGDLLFDVIEDHRNPGQWAFGGVEYWVRLKDTVEYVDRPDLLVQQYGQ